MPAPNSLGSTDPSFWSSLDLPSLLLSLPPTLSSLSSAAAASASTKRSLGAATKAYRQDEAAHSLPKPAQQAARRLLKAYQEGFDQLQARAQASDAAFADLAGRLRCAPDPAQLERELRECEAELAGARDQSVTVRGLEREVARLGRELGGAEARGEAKADERAEAGEEERRGKALDRERDLRHEVDRLSLELRSERAGRAALDESLRAQSGDGADRGRAWDAEKRLLLEEIAGAGERLHEAEAERDELRVRGAVGGERAAPGGGELEAYEREVAELEVELARARGEAAKARAEGKEGEARAEEEREKARREGEEKAREAKDLREKLAAAPTAAQLGEARRELAVLDRKSVV